MIQMQAHANTDSNDLAQATNANGKRLHRSNDNDGPRQTRVKNRRLDYPRKRAVTACQLCRARKTKCDNQRPACGFCTSTGANCRYEDRSDHSSFDPASLELLGQLHNLFRQQNAVLDTVRNIERGLLSIRRQPGNQQPSVAQSSFRVCGHAAAPSDVEGDIASSDPTIPPRLSAISSHTTPDSVLMWPVFENRFPHECLQTAIFQASSHSKSAVLCHPRNSTYGFREEEVLPLVENFRSCVHTKNPILDEDELMHLAMRVAEDGLCWDAPSCLILLVCALGSIAAPFHEARQFAGLAYEIDRSKQSTDHRQKLEKAESYYALARRRLGLLDQSILASQCHFLSGIYSMFALRPVEAFQSFHQSSVVFQVYSKSVRVSGNIALISKLEQRLYWSCFKSECEILSEITLPESGIATFEQPYTFPTPPSDPNTSAASPALEENDESPVSSSINSSHPRHRRSTMCPEQEQSWYYYLSEIALRRIGNRVLAAFYTQGPDSWLDMELSVMTNIARELTRQLDEWRDRLPSAINYVHSGLDEIPHEELPYMIRTRELEIRSWVLRPFLYYALHLPLHDHQQPVLFPLVEELTLCCSRLIRANAVRHRHHGTWYVNRLSVTAALCIVAASIKGLSLPLGWEVTIQIAVETLYYWENEGPGDMQKSRLILEELLARNFSLAEPVVSR